MIVLIFFGFINQDSHQALIGHGPDLALESEPVEKGPVVLFQPLQAIFNFRRIALDVRRVEKNIVRILVGIHFDAVIAELVLPVIGRGIILGDLAIHIGLHLLESDEGRIIGIDLAQVGHDPRELVDFAVGQHPLG